VGSPAFCLPPGAPADFFARVLRVAKRFGAKTVVDSSGPALSLALDVGVYLAKPNLRELCELVGRPLTQEGEWLAASRDLVLSEKAEILTLTLGESGALAVTRKGAWRAYAPSVQVVSTVGAGDSFLGAMIVRCTKKHYSVLLRLIWVFSRYVLLRSSVLVVMSG